MSPAFTECARLLVDLHRLFQRRAWDALGAVEAAREFHRDAEACAAGPVPQGGR